MSDDQKHQLLMYDIESFTRWLERCDDQNALQIYHSARLCHGNGLKGARVRQWVVAPGKGDREARYGHVVGVWPTNARMVVVVWDDGSETPHDPRGLGLQL